MYRIQEEQIEDKTIYTLQEGYVRKFKPMNGFGIAKEVVWMPRIRTTEANLVTEAYKAAHSMSSEDFKAYAKDQQKHFRGFKIKQVATKLNPSFADNLKELEEEMVDKIADQMIDQVVDQMAEHTRNAIEAKKYKALREVVECLVKGIDDGMDLKPDSLIVLALKKGLED